MNKGQTVSGFCNRVPEDLRGLLKPLAAEVATNDVEQFREVKYYALDR